MTTDAAFLNVTATDLEVSVKVWMLVKIISKGSVVVPAKFISQFVGSLPSEKITMESKDHHLHIECGNLKTQIQGYNPEDFPLIPEVKDAQNLQIPAKKIHQGLSQVIDVASPSKNRPEISGIYFSFSKNQLKMVATDSFRLAEKTITLDESLPSNQSFILPQKSAQELSHILENQELTATLGISPNQVLVELPMKESGHPHIQITSRLIEGEYPNYQDIIPGHFKTHVTVKREELLNQIKIAALFSNKINEIKVVVDESSQQLRIHAKSAEIGENTSSIPVKVEGESMELSFNHRYLADGLANIKSSEVIFSISKEDGPCVIKPVGDASYLYLVMPIKLI
jgi:DNA polymerase-3 subunit beta